MAVRKKHVNPRKQPTQERARATVDAIMKATAHILAKEGYEAANTNRIAQQAGVSIGSLYQYFPSKDAVVAALVEEYMERQRAIVVERVGRLRPDSELAEMVRELVGALFESRASNPRLHKVIVEEIPRVGRLGQLMNLHSQLSGLITAVLAAQGSRLSTPRLGLTIFCLVHAVDAMVNAIIFQAPESTTRAQAVGEITRLVSLGLGL